MNFQYLYKGKTHTDTSIKYMQSLGMDNDTSESIKGQEAFEARQAVTREMEWVNAKMPEADIQINMHLDDDERATLSLISWRTYRKALRDHVKAGTIATPRPTPIEILANQ